MKIIRYRYRNRECYGVLKGQTVVCLPALAKRFKKQLPPRIEEFIAAGENALKTAEDLLKKAKNNHIPNISAPVSKATLLAPIAFPPKIICLGYNYVAHAAAANTVVPDEPVIFMKPHTTIIGPNENIIKPSFVKELDYEGELAIVMGKKAKNIHVSEARKHIFGYTILNDVSARDFQFKNGQWTRGKSFDTFAPIGPCIATANQLGDAGDLAIRTWVNCELRQNSTTFNMAFNVSEIVQYISRVMTMEPCDIIATGTPAGVGFDMKPPKFLQHGDVVRIEIEGIGTLENTVEEK
jgi:2-keto-4-pentenoate hydratase/2-oxohepta-3-ene-1,7-dioic acid hydratase in catechol pathway